MSTTMTELDRQAAVAVFRASLPRRGAKGRNDRLFLEALHHHLASAAEALRQMERRVEAVRAVEQGSRLRDVLRPSGLVQFIGTSGKMRSYNKMRKKYVFVGSAPPCSFPTVSLAFIYRRRSCGSENDGS
jgi:hypothetical protein